MKELSATNTSIVSITQPIAGTPKFQDVNSLILGNVAMKEWQIQPDSAVPPYTAKAFPDQFSLASGYLDATLVNKDADAGQYGYREYFFTCPLNITSVTVGANFKYPSEGNNGIVILGLYDSSNNPISTTTFTPNTTEATHSVTGSVSAGTTYAIILNVNNPGTPQSCTLVGPISVTPTGTGFFASNFVRQHILPGMLHNNVDSTLTLIPSTQAIYYTCSTGSRLVFETTATSVVFEFVDTNNWTINSVLSTYWGVVVDGRPYSIFKADDFGNTASSYVSMKTITLPAGYKRVEIWSSAQDQPNTAIIGGFPRAIYFPKSEVFRLIEPQRSSGRRIFAYGDSVTAGFGTGYSNPTAEIFAGWPFLLRKKYDVTVSAWGYRALKDDYFYFNDTFTDSAGTALGSHNADSGPGPSSAASWVKASGFTSGAMVITAAGRVRSSTSNSGVYYFANAPTTADYDVDADIYVADATGAGAGIYGRLDTAGSNFYLLDYETGSTAFHLYSVIGGSTNQTLNYSMSLTVGQTYHVKLSMRGSTITAYVNGSPVMTMVDAGVTAVGHGGLFSTPSLTDSTGMHIDNFLVSTPQNREALLNEMVASDPTDVILAIGNNDYTVHQQSATTFQNQYAQLMDDIHARLPKAIVWTATPFLASTESANNFGSIKGDYRAAIATVQAARQSFSIFVDGIAQYSLSDVAADGIHPSTLGHAKMYNSWVSTLESPVNNLVPATSALSTQTTLLGSTSGVIVAGQPIQNKNFGKAVIYLNALNGTATYKFPAIFTFAPVALGPQAATATTITTSDVTITGLTTTGFLFLEGF